MTRQNEAFATAKRALHLVGEFGTPPTPDIYEVWYRYAEGSNRELVQALDFLVNESKSVSLETLRALHQQFCLAGTPVVDSVSEGL